MTNPIPIRVRGWLYVAGIVVGGLIAVVLPDLLDALGAGDQWIRLAVRASGALTLLLSTLGRSHLSDPSGAALTIDGEIVAEPIQDA